MISLYYSPTFFISTAFIFYHVFEGRSNIKQRLILIFYGYPCMLLHNLDLQMIIFNGLGLYNPLEEHNSAFYFDTVASTIKIIMKLS
jgi:hypothetical protein